MKKTHSAAAAIFFLFVPVFLSSCSKDLSRTRAKDLIISKYALPQTETMKIGTNYYISQDNGGGFGPVALIIGPHYAEFKEMLSDLETKGLIVVSQTNESKGGINYT